jgi:hypothetical protein
VIGFTHPTGEAADRDAVPKSRKFVEDAFAAEVAGRRHAGCARTTPADRDRAERRQAVHASRTANTASRVGTRRRPASGRPSSLH